MVSPRRGGQRPLPPAPVAPIPLTDPSGHLQLLRREMGGPVRQDHGNPVLAQPERRLVLLKILTLTGFPLNLVAPAAGLGCHLIDAITLVDHFAAIEGECRGR